MVSLGVAGGGGQVRFKGQAAPYGATSVKILKLPLSENPQLLLLRLRLATRTPAMMKLKSQTPTTVPSERDLPISLTLLSDWLRLSHMAPSFWHGRLEELRSLRWKASGPVYRKFHRYRKDVQ